MSASIYWTVKGDNSLNVGGSPSTFIESMKRAFHGMPVTLTMSDLDTLHGMAAVWHSSGEDENPFQKLADLVTEYGEVEVYAIY